uniref:Piwi domain-containing protein n=1 Tax=Macrostomum lignano TaxID=282301 RepID=A0A1I8GTA4_9PLAT
MQLQPPADEAQPGAAAAAAAPAVQGTEGGSEEVDRLAQGMELARLGGHDNERGGLSRKLLRYRIADVRPPGVELTRGVSGEPVALISNNIRLSVSTNFQAMQNKVLFIPVLESKQLRLQVLQDSGRLPDAFIYDGGILYTPQPLEAPPEGVHFEATAGRWHGEVTIVQIGPVLHNSPEYLHLLNVLIASAQQDLGMQQVQRNYFYPDREITLANSRLAMWPGFYATVVPSEEPEFPLLHVDLLFEVVHQYTVLDYMYEQAQVNKDHLIQYFNDALFGQSVMMRLNNNRKFRINDIDWEANVFTEFEYRDPATNELRSITIGEYYRTRYGYQIQDASQPMLMPVPRRRGQEGRGQAPKSLIPPELCIMTGLTVEMLGDRQLITDKNSIVRQRPRARYNRLMQFANDMAGNQASQQRSARYGVEIRPELVHVNGRRLPPEQVLMSSPRVDRFSDERSTTVASRVALQMSCKLGGIPWGLSMPYEGCMVVGMDSYHDRRHNQSVLGIVFSLNPLMTQYYSYAAMMQHGRAELHQCGRAELHQRLVQGFSAALERYRLSNGGSLPASIVIYRDGVSDSMLEQVKDIEFAQVSVFLRELYSAARRPPPGLKVIVVKKRISARFFLQQQQQQQNRELSNPLPGTVVDSTVTMPGYYDFYLVSQFTQ